MIPLARSPEVEPEVRAAGAATMICARLAGIETFATGGIGGGQLVCNPIPAEAEIPGAEIGPAIDAAIAEAAAQGAGGKALTPFLLAQFLAATRGRSLAANVALLLNDARLAGPIAGALAEAHED